VRALPHGQLHKQLLRLPRSSGPLTCLCALRLRIDQFESSLFHPRVRSPNKMGDEAERHTFKLFVGQVPMHLTADQLRNVFDPFGAIEDVTIIYDKSTQQSKGAVIVISS